MHHNVLILEFGPQGCRQAGDGMLGRAICGIPENPYQSGHGTDVHDPAATIGFKKGQNGLNAVQGAEKVDIHDVSEDFNSLVLKIPFTKNSGGIDQDVRSAELFNNLFECCLHGMPVCNITRIKKNGLIFLPGR